VDKLTNELNEAKEKILSLENELSTQTISAKEVSLRMESEISQLTEELELEKQSKENLTEKLREKEQQVGANQDLQASAQAQHE
jgi:hypothetical protein